MANLNPITRAIFITTTATSLSFAPMTTIEASTTMYNVYGAGTSPVTPDFSADGWVWGEDTPAPGNSSAATPGWKGTACPTCTPFNFVGGMALNWAAQLTGAGNSLTVSQQDAFNRYGIYADIDTSSGAWRDPSQINQHGTRHSIDIGLFKSDVSQTINLSIAGVTDPNSNYGITVFKGMAANLSYNHYGYPIFNNRADYFDYAETVTTTTVGNTTTVKTTTVNYILPYVTRSAVDPVSGLTSNTLSFDAEAGQIYTMMLGGNNGKIYGGYNGYQLTISSVPLPASAWLFVSGLFGLRGYKRQKNNG